MINPKRELFRWGPIDSKIVYTAFTEFLADFGKHLSPGWPDIIGYFKENKIWFICDYENLRKNGLVLFKNEIMNEEKTKEYYHLWLKTATKIVELQEEIENLSTLSDKQLSELFENWYNNYSKFWIYGSLPEVANWGGEMLLKDKLMETNKENFLEIFESLSSPEYLSFYQKEEFDLLKLKQIKNPELLDKKLKEHQKNYHWLRNSYGHAEVLSVSYFREELSKFAEEKAKEKIKEIQELSEKTREKKKEIIKKYKISKEIENIAKRLSYSIWWQDFRKKYIFMAIAEMEKFVIEVSRKFNIEKEELYQYFGRDLGDIIKTGKKVKNALDRKKGCMEYYHEEKEMERFDYEKSNEIIKPFLEIEVDENLEEIKGLPVSRGKVRGKVKIIFSPLKMTKMNFGDILVAPMTSPDFIIAMKKAAGIITDVGGMTSHAAIVSREMKKPCIVGTKIATKVLKDNDLIEIDANTGIVKILERANPSNPI